MSDSRIDKRFFGLTLTLLMPTLTSLSLEKSLESATDDFKEGECWSELGFKFAWEIEADNQV